MSYIIFSDWGVNLLDSVCDGHVDCNDLLTSITGSSILSLSLCGHGHIFAILLILVLAMLFCPTPAEEEIWFINEKKIC